jgi:hypothetical protein
VWIKLGDTLLGPLIESWRFVRGLQRDIVKDDGVPAPLPCTATAGRLPRRRRCTLPAFHSGPHEYR